MPLKAPAQAAYSSWVIQILLGWIPPKPCFTKEERDTQWWPLIIAKSERNMGQYISYFPRCYIYIHMLDEKQLGLRRKVYFGSQCEGTLWLGRVDGRSLRQLVTFPLQSGSGERRMLVFYSCSPLYSVWDPNSYDSYTQIQGRSSPLTKLPWKVLHRHTYRCVFWLILKLIKFIRQNYHHRKQSPCWSR